MGVCRIFFTGGEIRGTEDGKSPALSGVEFWWDRGIIIIIIITRLMTHVKSFTKWRIVSVGGHESAKVSSVVKFSLYQSLERDPWAKPQNLMTYFENNTHFVH